MTDDEEALTSEELHEQLDQEHAQIHAQTMKRQARHLEQAEIEMRISQARAANFTAIAEEQRQKRIINEATMASFDITTKEMRNADH